MDVGLSGDAGQEEAVGADVAINLMDKGREGQLFIGGDEHSSYVVQVLRLKNKFTSDFFLTCIAAMAMSRNPLVHPDGSIVKTKVKDAIL